HKSADVLRAMPSASVDVVEKCSAVDGTWGFKQEYYELSMKLAKPLFYAVTAGAPVAATDCPLAALQIEQGTGKKPTHPVEVLAGAYGFEEEFEWEGGRAMKELEQAGILNLVE